MRSPAHSAYIESLTLTRISGWYAPADGVTDLAVDLLIDGRIVAEGLQPQGARDDVTAALGVARAFEISAQVPVMQGAGATVRVLLRRSSDKARILKRKIPVVRYVGWIDGIEGDRIKGWAFDSTSDDPIRVSLFHDSSPLASDLLADQSREDVATQHPGRGATGFLVPIPEAWRAADGTLRPVGGRIRLRAADGTLVTELTGAALLARSMTPDAVAAPHAARGPRLPSLPPAVPPHADGRVEQLRGGALSGWVVDLERPGRPVEVELRVGGTPLGRTVASGEREDVGQRYPGHPASGFSLPLEPDLLPTGRHKVEVVMTASGREVRSRVSVVEGLRGTPRLSRLPEARPVSIVVPVYNAPEETGECIESLLAHTDLAPGRAELILLDDKSPDEAVVPLLRRYEDHPAIHVVLQPQNVGYTGNINHGIELAGESDVVLLNSDTRVGPGWLRRLRIAAARRESIGTVTAVSDNAGAFSVPRMNEANPVPSWTDEEGYARLTMQRAGLLHPSVPTGSGFCLFVKRALLDDIGLFDAEAFPRGYGEENEFCMRAAHRGWEHVVAEDAMIFHERSASFKAAKDTLIKDASRKLPELYPEYRFAVRRDFLTGMGMGMVRQAAGGIANGPCPRPRPRIAFVIGIDSGGTSQTNMDLMSAIHEEYEPWLLLAGGGWLKVFRIEGARRVEVERHRVSPAVEPVFHDSPAYREIVADLLQRLAFELIHVRHVAHHGLSLFAAARRLGIPVVFSLHDFYAVCPNVKLLDAEGRFCGGVCTSGEGDCGVELWRSERVPQLRGQWVRSWQSRFAEVLRGCDHLVTTSPFAKRLVCERYGLEDVPFSVIEHGRDFAGMQRAAAPPAPDEPLRILVPGSISDAKGLSVIEGVKALDVEGRLEFHFAGRQQRDVSGIGVVHGPYERDALPELIARIAPHLGAVLSIWPETYSHTITELWSSGVPVITGDLGAPGERVARHGGGWSVADLSPEAVYRRLLEIADAPAEIAARIDEVAAWQEGHGSAYSIPVMAAGYLRVYDDLLSHGAPRPRVLALPVGADGARDLGHLRAPLEALIGPHAISRLPAGAGPVLDRLAPARALVLHYSCEPPEGAAHAALLEEAPLVLDIQPDCDPSHLAEPGMAPCLDALLARAARVIVPPGLVQAAEARAPGRVEASRYDAPEGWAEGRGGAHALGMTDWRRLEAHPAAGHRASAILMPAPGEALSDAPSPDTLERIVLRATGDPGEATLRIDPDLGLAASVSRAAAHARGEVLLLGPEAEIVREAEALVSTLRRMPGAAVAASGEGTDPSEAAFAIRMTDLAKLRGLDPRLSSPSEAVADLMARAEAVLGRGTVRL